MTIDGDPTSSLLETVEHVADTLHEELDFWRSDPRSRGFCLFTAFDQLAYCVGALVVDPSLHTEFTLYNDGISHCLRWHLRKSGEFGRSRSITPDEIKVARNFLNWGKCYQIICDIFRTYRQGLLVVDEDVGNKKLKFRYENHRRSAVNVVPQLEGHAALKKKISNRGKGSGQLDVLSIRAAISDAVSLGDNALFLSNDTVLGNTHVDQLVKWLRHEWMWIPLSNDCDFGGYSLGQFREFWSVLRRWAAVIVSAAQSSVRKGVAAGCSPTQVVSAANFRERISRYSGLESNVVDAITEQLVIRRDNDRADLYLTPLVCDDDHIIWSPHCVNTSEYVRNHLKALVRSETTKANVDTILGSLEKPIIDEIRRRLEKYGYSTKSNRRIVSGVSGEIDLLAWTPKARSEVLLIEAKYILSPDDVNETKDFTAKMIGGKKQIEKCQEILERMSVDQKQRIFGFVPWHEVSSVFGMVICNAGTPSELYEAGLTPWLSLDVIKQFLRHSDFKTPRALWEAAIHQSWICDLDDSEQYWRTMRVGEYEIEIPHIGVGRLPDDAGDLSMSVAGE